MKLEFQKITDVKSPVYGTSGSAGIDFFIPKNFNSLELQPGEQINIASGIKAKIPEGYALIAFNKSSIALEGLSVGACIVDSDYQGEIHLHVYNRSKKVIGLFPDKKLVQFLLVPVLHVELKEVECIKFEKSERGEGSFGSTNK